MDSRTTEKTVSYTHLDVYKRQVFRYRHIYPMAIQAVADGKINLKGIVTDEFPLDEADKAMEFSMNNKADIVKAVIKIHE